MISAKTSNIWAVWANFPDSSGNVLINLGNQHLPDDRNARWVVYLVKGFFEKPRETMHIGDSFGS